MSLQGLLQAAEQDLLAAKIAIKLNDLNWPEMKGLVFPKPSAEHVIKNDYYTLAVAPSCKSVMFSGWYCVHKFVAIPEDVQPDVWVAMEFLSWIKERELS